MDLHPYFLVTSIEARLHHAMSYFYFIMISSYLTNVKERMREHNDQGHFEQRVYFLINLSLNLPLHHLFQRVRSERVSGRLLQQNTPVSLVVVAALNFDSRDLTTQLLELPLLEQVVIAVEYGH